MRVASVCCHLLGLYSDPQHKKDAASNYLLLTPNQHDRENDLTDREVDCLLRGAEREFKMCHRQNNSTSCRETKSDCKDMWLCSSWTKKHTIITVLGFSYKHDLTTDSVFLSSLSGELWMIFQFPLKTSTIQIRYWRQLQLHLFNILLFSFLHLHSTCPPWHWHLCTSDDLHLVQCICMNRWPHLDQMPQWMSAGTEASNWCQI